MIARFLLFATSSLLIAISSKAQILDDRMTMEVVQRGIDHIYNYEFAEADAMRRQLQSRYPGHPVTYFISAFQMYWQYLPIIDR